MRFQPASVLIAVVAAFTLLGSASAQSSNGLTTIDNPGGGQVVYGPITNATSQGDVIVAMLKNVHTHFGDKPQITKFFQPKGSDSVATFFHLTAKNQGNKPISGLLIVSLAPGAKEGAAAVLYDDAARFAKTEPALVRSLNQAWQKQNAKYTTRPSSTGGTSGDNAATTTRGRGPGGIFGTNEPATSSLPLHLAKSPDNSGSIGLPDGWHVTGGGGGSLLAEGNHGELIRMGVLIGNIYDPRTPQGSQMLNYMSRGTTPAYSCPYVSDLTADYLCVTNQYRQRQHEQPMSLHVLNSRMSQGDPSAGAFLVNVDTHDGKGPMLSSIKIGTHRMGPGSWTLTIDEVRIPQTIADSEWSTAAGMIMSYRQNEGVIHGETMTVINQINERAKANQTLIDARSHANDVHNAQVNQQWDDQARQNKAFENYTLDLSVVHDPQSGGTYGRFDYPSADALVQADPDHFQIANSQNYIKGRDF